nr:OmpA family protein [Nannocystis sp.]
MSERLRLDRRGQLPRDAARLLDSVARTLQAAPDIHVWVDAHIDPQRDPAVALQITQRVAEEVVEELLRRGVARERLVPRGFGDALPIASSGGPSGPAEDRRVEFAAQPCRIGSTQQARECL